MGGVQTIGSAVTGVGGQTGVKSGTLPDEYVALRYTGYTSNANAASRAAIAEDIKVGSLVCYDDVTGTSGTPLAPTSSAPGDRLERIPGMDVTQPATALLDRCAGVVVEVPKGSERGGIIHVAKASQSIKVRLTKGSAVAVGDIFKPANASFVGVVHTFAITDAATTAASIRQAVVEAVETTSGAVTDSLVTCRGRPFAGCSF